jgi:predicted phage tail protein
VADGTGKAFSTSQTYGWSAGENVSEPGRAIPVLFGKHRVVPPMIARYVESVGDKQYLNMLFAVCGHEVDYTEKAAQLESGASGQVIYPSIDNIHINDQPVDNYENIFIDSRAGLQDQPSVWFFNDQRTDELVNIPITAEWSTRQLSQAVDRFGVGLAAPRGLYYANDKGGLDEITLQLEMQYRKIGDTSWRPWVGLAGYHDGDGAILDSGNVVFGSGNSFIHIADVFLYQQFSKGMLDSSVVLQTESPSSPGTWLTHNIEFVRTTVRQTMDSFYNSSFTFVCELTVSGDPVPAGVENYRYTTPAALTAGQNDTKRWWFECLQPYDGKAQYEYRFRFASEPPDGNRYGTEVRVDYHQHIVEDPFSYPYTAILGVRALATDQLSGSQPRVSCDVERSTIPIPENGIDGGALVDMPADNPAWVCYFLLHNALNGGGVDAERIEYDAFEAWAANCTANSLTCNIYFDDITNLKRALDVVGMLGRGQVVQMGSRFTCITDFPDDSVQRFSFGMGNIAVDSFNEEWLPMEDRADTIEVTFWDAANDYARTPVTVQQNNVPSSRQENRQTLMLYGCTDREMALKHAKFLLNKARYLTLTASWSADIDALACMPGDIVDVSHDVPQWGQSGRIVAATADTVTLDREVPLVSGNIYAVDVRHGDDTRETATITATADETTDTLNLDAPWTTIPQQYDNYAFGPVNNETKAFRVVSISKDKDLRRKVQALEYYPEVYDDDVLIPELTPPTSAGIFGLNVREAWVTNADGSGRSILHASWRDSAILTGYFSTVPVSVYIRQGDSAWQWLGNTFDSHYIVDRPLVVGKTYTVSVARAGTPAGQGEQASVTIEGKAIAPDIVYNIAAAAVSDGIQITWDEIDSVDRLEYVIVSGTDFETGTELGRVARGPFHVPFPITPDTYQFWVAAVDRTGNVTETPESASIIIEAPDTPAPAYTVVGEQLQIRWPDAKTSFPIDYYTVAAEGVTDELDARVYSERISWTGTRQYMITAYDASGNASTTATLDVSVDSVPAPSALVATGHPYEIRLTFSYTQGPNFEALEIWAAKTTNNRDLAVKIAETGATSHTLSGVDLSDTYYFWIRQRDTFGNHSDWYPAGQYAGVEGAASNDPADYLEILAGSITEDELFSGLLDRINMIDTDMVYSQVYSEVFTGLDGYVDGLYRNDMAIRGSLIAESNARLELGARVTVNEDSIISHSAQLTTLENAINDPETGLDALSSATRLLDSRVEVTEGDITANATAITNLEVVVNDPGTGVSANASAVDALDARVTVNEGDITAIASDITTLEAGVGDNSASITTNATAIANLEGDVKAEYSLWLNANGHITGFRSMIDHTGSSEFDIVSDRFRIINQNSSGDLIVPFVVGTVNGVSTVGINGNLVIDGSILARHIDVDTLSAISAELGTVTVSGTDGILVEGGGNIEIEGADASPAELRLFGTSYSASFKTTTSGSVPFFEPSSNNVLGFSVGTYFKQFLKFDVYASAFTTFHSDNIRLYGITTIGQSAGHQHTITGFFQFNDRGGNLSSASGAARLWAHDNNTGTTELQARSSAGDAVILTPHRFDLFTPSEDYEYPWSYHAENPFIGKRIEVDMYGAIAEIEKLSGKKFIYCEDMPDDEMHDWDKYQAESIKARGREIEEYNKLPQDEKAKMEEPRPLATKAMPQWMQNILNKRLEAKNNAKQ